MTSPATTPIALQTGSAKTVFDQAPLGAVIRFNNGEARPPERFKRKLKSWKYSNDAGRLTAKNPGSDRTPPTITLHMGDITSKSGVQLVTYFKTFTVDDDLSFAIESVPQPGSVLILQRFDQRSELLHIADDQAAADVWLREHRHSNTYFETVPQPI